MDYTGTSNTSVYFWTVSDGQSKVVALPSHMDICKKK